MSQDYIVRGEASESDSEEQVDNVKQKTKNYLIFYALRQKRIRKMSMELLSKEKLPSRMKVTHFIYSIRNFN